MSYFLNISGITLAVIVHKELYDTIKKTTNKKRNTQECVYKKSKN